MLFVFSILISCLTTGYFLRKSFDKTVSNITTDVLEFSDKTYQIEKRIISSIPIYDDYVSSINENDLRKHLHADHMKVARENGLMISNDQLIDNFEKNGTLVKLSDNSDYYFFYNVPKKYRYLSPDAAELLEIIGDRFNKILSGYNVDQKIKFAVSSALRPMEYQNNLVSKNLNAADESSHSYSVSFDIFFDDYYLLFDDVPSDRLSSLIINKIRIRYGYILGDSLRRQFKTVMAQTLLELQSENRLYVILEKRQRCFHVTSIKR